MNLMCAFGKIANIILYVHVLTMYNIIYAKGFLNVNVGKTHMFAYYCSHINNRLYYYGIFILNFYLTCEVYGACVCGLCRACLPMVYYRLSLNHLIE